MFILGVTFTDFIQRTNVIVGLILAVVGLAIWLLANKFACVVRKSDSVKSNDSVLVGTKVLGLVMLMVGMILIAIPV